MILFQDGGGKKKRQGEGVPREGFGVKTILSWAVGGKKISKLLPRNPEG